MIFQKEKRNSCEAFVVSTEKVDREGGRPVDLSIKKLDINGFLAKQEWGSSRFLPPCIFYANTDPITDPGNGSASSAEVQKVKHHSNESKLYIWSRLLDFTETFTLILLLYWPMQAPSSSFGPKRKMALIFICVPVSPGKSRLLWVFPRNFGVWIDRVVPRWMFHIGQNLILDSDLYLLHVEVIFLK